MDPETEKKLLALARKIKELDNERAWGQVYFLGMTFREE
jgi:hypothetical protein